jgi:hypothetical protein
MMSHKRTIRAGVCVALTLLAMGLPIFGQDVDPTDANVLRTGMTIAGAGIGLVVGSAIALGFSLDAIDTPLSNTLLLTIPVAAAGATTGALAGRWMADITLRHPPSPLFAIVEGAGLGLASGAFVGAVTFTLNFVLANELLEVPEGYWGRYDYLPTIGLGVAAGGFWGGFWGMLGGAIALPVVSLLMGF